ncbi:MAG: MoxR family ATPase, partial [Desulfurococcaceae archaeon]
ASWKIEREGYRAPQPVLSIEDLKTINSLILSVDVSRVKQQLIKLYAVLEDQGVHLTDRRKGKALKVIAAHAFLNNRLVASEEDLFALKYVAAGTREEAEKVQVILLEELGTRERLLSELREVEENIREAKAFIARVREFDPRLIEYLRGFERAREKIRRIAESATDEYVKKRALDLLVEVGNMVEDIKKRLLM